MRKIKFESPQIASQVLDYWFTIEFLGQDTYETCTNENKLCRALKQFKKENQNITNRRKQISVFESINEGCDIYAQIVKQAQECGMTIWGNLTFYIGKIRRQACIEKLAQELGINLKQAEKDSEYIPILSFQCTSNGRYVKHSLSLSTVIWAISQVEGKRIEKLSNVLSRNTYTDVVKDLEKNFFYSEDIDEQQNAGDEKVKLNSEGIPTFSDDAIAASKIMSIHAKLLQIFGKFFPENMIEKKNGFTYQLFKDASAKNKYEDNRYMGLSHDFFSEDLQMVKDSIEAGRDNYATGMLSELIEYICAPHDEFKKRKRHDFVRPKNKETFYTEMAEILNAGNAPLGKWPSKYMPALMQQLAINIAISNRQRGIFQETGNIFSVNGPPGTGKTTLLKEIIANNIVEKARVLSQYDEPDDAFEGVKFMYGELNGAYVKYYPKWFKFKDDHIADFGVLVASSNNTAVENITKELPLTSGILDNLKVNSNGLFPDCPELTRQLGEICALFSPVKSKKKLSIYQKDAKCKGEYPEIYFTGYAKKFLGNSEKDADAWGLVAAPLGKKSNVSGFYYDVLNPLWQDFLMKNEDIQKRIAEYKITRNVFSEQLEKVISLRNVLKHYGDDSLKAHQLYVKSKETQEKNSALITGCKLEIKSIENQLMYFHSEIEKEVANHRKLVELFAEADSIVKASEAKMQDLSNQEIAYKKQALDVENSVGLFTRIFRKTKYQSALDLAESLRVKAHECANAFDDASQKIAIERANLENCLANKDNSSRQLQGQQARLKALEEKRSASQIKILKLEKEIKDEQLAAETAKKKFKESIKVYQNAGDTKTGKILDEKFIEDILSKNDETGTKAQLTNPWLTEEFNREREKLFYFALQMTREFILSSKACRANLCILGQYWGLKTESGTDKIKFHKQDSEAMMCSLFQTLFLLTPVISSTFASIGSLLKDMKKPGCIGTLIIDEAGQAQPQMAVGSLYRSRKAIIVGDPKQVEPVVTDDLKLLKEAYSEPVYSNYKNKSISVQYCADIINPFGTFLDNGTDYPNWVGCPLLVHRRCVSPMYEISNQISYGGIMKQQTLPPNEKKISSFISEKSQWINVSGNEKGDGNHYVAEQGKIICNMVNIAFKKAIGYSENRLDANPDLYIISPFTSVVRELRNAIRSYANLNKTTALGCSRSLDKWLDNNIGTVHRFQGKEANEVIFVLGGDETVKNGYAIRGFVNSNIVNVAATRAKYRFYIIGDIKVWRENEFVNTAKSIIDTLPIKKIAEIECWEKSEEKNNSLLEQARQLPGASSFVSQNRKNEEDNPVYDIDVEGFVSSIDQIGFLNSELSLEQYQLFGFLTKKEFNSLPEDVKQNLLMGMKLYFLLNPVYDLSPDLDASCCGILFCKGMELYLRENFAKGLKIQFPDFNIKNSANKMISLQYAENKDFMIGAIHFILRNNAKKLGSYMKSVGKTGYDKSWWDSFNNKLKEFANKRNDRCHPQGFKWQDFIQLLYSAFKEDCLNEKRNPKIGGVFFESKIGKSLIYRTHSTGKQSKRNQNE